MSQSAPRYAESVTVLTPTSPPPEIELLRLDPDGQSSNEEVLKSATPPKLELAVVTESIVETMEFADNFPMSFNPAPSVHSTPTLPNTDADCFIVENKETDDGPDYIPL